MIHSVVECCYNIGDRANMFEAIVDNEKHVR